jgi:hypothetical protein
VAVKSFAPLPALLSVNIRMLSQIDKQIFKSWRHTVIDAHVSKLLGRAPRSAGPRIAVLGNCQSYGVAYGVKLLEPTATVDHYSAIGRSFTSVERLAKTLATYDYVFSHEWPHGHVKGGGSSELRQLLPKMILFPSIVFAAFHPDLIYINDPRKPGSFLEGPLRPYHSALGLFAYRKGLSLEAANALFNENIYEALGYFDIWNQAAKELIDNAAASYEFDLATDFTNWSRRGVFMHSILHPRGFVLHDVARLLMRKAGLAPRATNTDYYDIDDLSRSEIFPVYPPIAKRFGVGGSYLFKSQNQHLSNGVGKFHSLPEYLAACYRCYAKYKPEEISNPRVDAWLADAEASERLVRLARGNLMTGLTPTF